mgnify:CR=1 FL=1
MRAAHLPLYTLRSVMYSGERVKERIEALEKKLSDLLNSVVEELGLSEPLVVVNGRADCTTCIRIEVRDEESFARAVSALLRQGVATGALPIVITRHIDMSGLRYAAVDYVNQVIVELSIALA